MNVLLVDDESMMRKMVKLALQKRGFHVFDTSNAGDAIAVSEQHPIDLLITDIVMEEIDGWTLAGMLAERRDNLPIVFTSGYPVNFECKRGDHACWTFLPKPFMPQDLMQAISAITCTPV